MVQFYKAPGSGKGRRHKKTLAQSARESSVFVDVLDHHGNGIVLSSEPITVIEGALPKETVTVGISSVSKNVRRGKVIEVENSSEYRIKASCKVYQSCGGCNLQIVNAQRGLAYKRDALIRYFSTMLDVDEEAWQPSILSDIDYSDAQQNIGYRRKVRLAVDARDTEHIKIGYRQQQSNKVVDIATCPILHPILAQKVEILLPLLKSLGCIQKVGHFECTQTKDGVLLLINLAKAAAKESLGAFAALSETAKVRIVCRFNQQTLADIGQHHASLVIEDVQDIRLEMAEQHFIQVNAAVNHKMIRQAIQWLAPDDTTIVRDFYCGLGNFSLPLAQKSRKVIGYEVSESMVAQAIHNAAINQVDNASFELMDLSDEHQVKHLQVQSSDMVLLDPSREGAQALCEVLVKLKPIRIVYVSCNPNTLARDLKILSARYKVKALSILDMFPFTQHLETMALLTLK